MNTDFFIKLCFNIFAKNGIMHFVLSFNFEGRKQIYSKVEFNVKIIET